MMAMGANMRHFKRAFLMLALGLPLGTLAAGDFSGGSLRSPAGDCAGIAPSFGLVRQTLSVGAAGPMVEGYVYGDDFEGGALLMTWADLFGTDFPSRPSSSTQVAIEVGKFIALQFTAGPSGDPIYAGVELGTLQVAQSAANSGQLALSISTCPGDFTNQASAGGLCRFNGGQGIFPWLLTATDPVACTFAENTTYFLNLAFVDVVGSNSCTAPAPSGPPRCETQIAAH
jgi:hypothetical protein